MLYANHAAISPWPRVTQEAVREFIEENCETGPLKASRWLIRESELRKRLARMLNADSGNDIALLKNTTEGICLVANGLDWRTGDNLVTPASEFISNQMPWDALAAKGVEIRRVDILNSDDPEKALAEAMDDRTRLLTVSAVQWDNGFRLDLETLGRYCTDREVLFFVDAIQQFGTHRIDIKASHINALSASAHKWQMGPEGIAVFHCDESTRRQLELQQLGWRILDDPYRFNRTGREPSASARRFEAGSPNTIGQVALFASLGLFEKVGLDEVERLIQQNTAQLSRGISDIPGLKLISSADPRRYSGIVSAQPRNASADSLRRIMSQSACFVAVRGKAIRLSPHFYQNGDPVNRMLNALEDAV